MIRIGLIGTGSMGGVHAQAYAGIPDAAVTAVVGRNPRTTADLATATGARAYDSVEAMLDADAVDVVDCCLPTPLHRSTVELAAARGRHVICEKPLALTVDDARAIIGACHDAHVHLLVAQVLRFFPAYRQLAHAVREGRLGRPVTCTLLRQGFYPAGRDSWFQDDERSGGVLLDLMIHDFDWALYQFGPAERVYARLVRTMDPLFAQGMATVRHRSGVLTQLTGTWGHPGPFTTAAEIAGTGGLISFSSEQAVPLRILSREVTGSDATVPLPDLSGGEDPYRTQLQHFVDVVAGRVEPAVRPEEALAALRLALAARTSARTGRPETLVQEEVA